MTKIAFVGVLVLTMASTVLPGTPAQAQATRTWVSSFGDDANPCSPSGPCRTFAGAFSKTAPGGEIDALDPGGYGAMTITKSLTIDGGGGQVASVLVSSGAGIIINAPGAVVTLRNLSFQGLASATNGINMLNAARVSIENCTIMNFTTYGVTFAPSVAGSKLTITNTVIHDNGYGIVTLPVPSGLAGFLTLDNVKVFHNGVGMYVGDNTSATATRTLISMNTMQGIAVNTYQSQALLHLSDSSVSNNSGPGMNLSQSGGHPIVQLTDTDIVSNTGASMQIGAGTDVISFGTNRIANNGADNLPNGSAMLH